MLANKVNKTKKVMVHKISVEQYSKYEKLLKAIAEQEHQSCLIFNRSITLQQMNLLINNRRVREFLLGGLNNQDCEKILNDFQFNDITVSRLALKIVVMTRQQGTFPVPCSLFPVPFFCKTASWFIAVAAIIASRSHLSKDGYCSRGVLQYAPTIVSNGFNSPQSF